MTLWLGILALGLTGAAGCALPPPAKSPERPEETFDDAIAAEAWKTLRSLTPPPHLDRGCMRYFYENGQRKTRIDGQGDGKIQKCEVIRYVVEHPSDFPEIAHKLFGGHALPWELSPEKLKIVRRFVQDLKKEFQDKGYVWEDPETQKEFRNILDLVADLESDRAYRSVFFKHTRLELSFLKGYPNTRLLDLDNEEIQTLSNIGISRFYPDPKDIRRHLNILFQIESGLEVTVLDDDKNELSLSQYLVTLLGKELFSESEKSRENLENALALDPDAAWVPRNLAQIYASKNDLEKAATFIEKAAALNRDDLENQAWLASKLYAHFLPKALKDNQIPDIPLDLLDRSLVLLKKGLETHPHSPELHEILGMGLMAKALLPLRTTWGKITFDIDAALASFTPSFEKAIANGSAAQLPYLAVGVARLRKNPNDAEGLALLVKGAKMSGDFANLLGPHLPKLLKKEALERIQKAIRLQSPR